MEKTYLGDGVYARFDGAMIIIYTSDGIGESNHIYLEPQVFDQLVKFGTKMYGEAN